MPETMTPKQREAQLRRLIARGVKMERLQAAIKKQYEDLEEKIDSAMKDLNLRRFVGETGEALLVESSKRKWQEELLEAVLTVKQFKLYCPPTADGGALGAYLKSLSNDEALQAKVAACSNVTPTETIRLASAAEVKKRKVQPQTERRNTPTATCIATHSVEVTEIPERREDFQLHN